MIPSNRTPTHPGEILREEFLEPLGLTVSSFRLIGEVMRAPGGIRQSELASRLGVRPPSISVAVRKLEERGTLVRVPDPDDPRARLVRIREPASLGRGFAVLAHMDDVVFGAFDDAERDNARAVLRALADHMEAR